MAWLFVHGGAALYLVSHTWRSGNRVYIDSAIALAYWFVLRQLVYQYGVVEREGMFAVMAAFIAFATLNWARHRHWTSSFLLSIGLTNTALNYFWPDLAASITDPIAAAYWYKTGWGVSFALCILVVWIACRR